MTPRYAVWQNAQQLPLFQQGEPPQKKPWLAFLVGFWLAWLRFWLAFWLAFWLVLVGFWLVWLGSWLWFGLALAWLLAGFLAGLVVWLGSGWLGWLSGWFGLAPGWFGLAPGWLSGWFGLAFFSTVFLACLAETQLAGHFASVSRGHYFAATRLRAAF